MRDVIPFLPLELFTAQGRGGFNFDG